MFTQGYQNIYCSFSGIKYVEVQSLNQFLSGSSRSEDKLRINVAAADLEIMEDTPKNGDCFFEAVSSQLRRLGMIEKVASKLRTEVVGMLMDHPYIEVG